MSTLFIIHSNLLTQQIIVHQIQVKLYTPKRSVTYWLVHYHSEHLLRLVKTAPVKMELWLTMASSALRWMLVHLSSPSPPALPPVDWPLLFALVDLLRRWWILHSWISPDDIGIVISFVCVCVCVCVFTHYTRRINWDGDGCGGGEKGRSWREKIVIAILTSGPVLWVVGAFTGKV